MDHNVPSIEPGLHIAIAENVTKPNRAVERVAELAGRHASCIAGQFGAPPATAMPASSVFGQLTLIAP